MSRSLIVLDNGAHTAKVGVAGKNQQPMYGHAFSLGYTRLLTWFPRIIPNAVVRSKGDKRVYFGHEIAQCKDYSSLHYRLPFEKVGIAL